MAIIPVPTSRSSDLLLRERLLNQLQSDQLSLLRIQDQVSTGRRIQSPSEDAPAAIRAISLQALLERKDQVRNNLQATNSFLSASSSTLNDASDLLTNIRGLTLSVATTVATDVERAAVVEEINRAIIQLQNMGNREFRGRHLFAGSTTTTVPFQLQDDLVSYQGNERSLQSFSDISQLTSANVSGHAVFGGFSEAVRGDRDLDPILTLNTRLRDLRGGLGISEGSILISDGNTSSTVSIESAETVGDLVRLLESHPPEGRSLTVRLQDSALVLELDDAGGGNLTVQDISHGTTAAELGIANSLGTGTDALVGEDINPRLRQTTRLADILGTRAWALIDSGHADSDIRIEAVEPGSAFNDIRFQYVDDDLLQAADGISAGNETARYESAAVPARAALTLDGANNNLVLTANSAGVDFNNVEIDIVNGGAIGDAATANYDPVARRLTLGIDQTGATQVQTLVNAIQGEGTFTAASDPSDVSDGPFLGSASVAASNIGIATGNTGNSGGDPGTIFVHVAAEDSTASQVVEALQSAPDVAELFNATLDGKDSDDDIEVGEGLVDVSATAVSGGGSGEAFDAETGIRITNGGKTYTIQFDDSETIEDLLNTLNGSGAGVLAEINAGGNGINVRSRLSGADFSIAENGGQTARQLGLLTFTGDTRLSELNHGLGVETEPGTDFLIRRNDGVELQIDISDAVTVQDVLDIINQHPDNQGAEALEARLRTVGNGIELVDDNPAGSNSLTLTKEGYSNAAWDLRLIPRGSLQVSVDQAAEGLGTPATPAVARVEFAAPNDTNSAIVFTATETGTIRNGTTIEIRDTLAPNSTPVVTFDGGAERLVIEINQATTSADAIIAAVNSEGTFGAERDLVADPGHNGSGTVGLGEVGVAEGGEPELLTTEDPNPQEVSSVFNTLIRLKHAVEDFDLREIERAANLLEVDFTRLNFARADLGARENALDSMMRQLEDENVQLRTQLSLEIDVDVVEAVSDLTARQASMEASLRLIGRTLQLTLLNFL